MSMPSHEPASTRPAWPPGRLAASHHLPGRLPACLRDAVTGPLRRFGVLAEDYINVLAQYYGNVQVLSMRSVVYHTLMAQPSTNYNADIYYDHIHYARAGHELAADVLIHFMRRYIRVHAAQACGHAARGKHAAADQPHAHAAVATQHGAGHGQGSGGSVGTARAHQRALRGRRALHDDGAEGAHARGLRSHHGLPDAAPAPAPVWRERNYSYIIPRWTANMTYGYEGRNFTPGGASKQPATRPRDCKPGSYDAVKDRAPFPLPCHDGHLRSRS